MRSRFWTLTNCSECCLRWRGIHVVDRASVLDDFEEHGVRKIHARPEIATFTPPLVIDGKSRPTELILDTFLGSCLLKGVFVVEIYVYKVELGELWVVLVPDKVHGKVLDDYLSLRGCARENIVAYVVAWGVDSWVTYELKGKG